MSAISGFIIGWLANNVVVEGAEDGVQRIDQATWVEMVSDIPSIILRIGGIYSGIWVATQR